MSGDAQVLLSGTMFAGRYRVEGRLGMGGMGAVYLATQEPLGRRVALKVLRPSLVDDPIAVQRFRSEAKIVAQLGHPHIVGIYELDTAPDGRLYIAMEFLPGESIAARLRTSGALAWERTLPIVRGIARALSAAHRRGVIHRDLKPDNVMLCDVEGMNDFVKVLDFGIAKIITSGEGAPNLTGTGFVPGTPSYIAPEQIVGGGGDDPRSDLYSLGVTWYEMLTARRPFDGDSAMKILLAHLHEPVPALAARRPDLAVPDAVDGLVRALLAKDPQARPRDADTLIGALDDVEAGLFAERSHARPVVTPSPSATTHEAPDAATLSSATPQAAATSVFPWSPMPVAAQRPAVDAAPTGAVLSSTLVAERRAWTKRLVAAAAIGVVAIGALVYIGVQHMVHKEDRWGDLPIHDEAASAEQLGDAVQAYLDADRARASAAIQRVLATNEREPGALALAGLLADDRTPHGRAVLLRKAKDALVPLDTVAPHEGGALIVALDAAYQGGAPELRRRWDECGTECSESVLALVAAGDVLGSEAINDVDAALEMFERAIVLAPRRVAPHERKSTVLLRDGRVHEAVAAARRGLQVAGDAPALLEVAGRAHLAAGEIGDALFVLKAAVEKNPGVSAKLALAHAYLLADDEDARKLTIDALLQDATPAQVCAVSAAHALALIGAVRGDSAYSLLLRCREASAAADDIAAALLTAAGGFDALDDVRLWERVAALLREHASRSASAREALETIEAVGAAIVSAHNGDGAGARAKLDGLETRDEARWPRGARAAMLDLVRFRVLALEGKMDDALLVARRLEGECRARARAARLQIDAGLAAGAAADIQWLQEKATLCRQDGFAGAFVLQALIMRAELDAQKNPAAAAARLRADRDRLFPRLEDGALKRQADAQMTLEQ